MLKQKRKQKVNKRKKKRKRKRNLQLWPPKARENWIFIDEESETDEEKDVDAALEEAISRAARTKEAGRSLRELIASITVEQLATTTPSPAATKQTLTKSLVPTPRASNKRKGAQPSRYAIALWALEEPETKKTKLTLPKVTKATGSNPTNATKGQKKK